MDDFESSQARAGPLSQMMAFGAQREPLFRPEELGAILQHQLAAPLERDLSLVDPSLSSRMAKLVPPGGPPLRTFLDLFVHPSPPVELLELTKRFAKSSLNHPDRPLPEEIVVTLYYLSILVALGKCRQRITRADEQSLRYGIEWALEQPWLDKTTRALFAQARTWLGP